MLKLLQTEFLINQKNKESLIYEGYVFNCEKEKKDGRKFWKCNQYYAGASKCGKRVHTKGEEVIAEFSQHNHTTSPAEIEALKARSTIRKRAIESRDAPALIIAEATAELNPAALAQLPPLDTMKRTIRAERKIELGAPANPKSTLELEIPDNYRVTKRGELFLLFDSGPSNKRILMFTTHSNLDWLSCEMWAADGTFDLLPEIFEQLYTIHPLRDQTALPAVFALLPDKTQNSYEIMLRELLTLKPNLKPRVVLTDFEKAAINAFQNCFPDIVQRGCFFHFSQCIWRKVLKINNFAIFQLKWIYIYMNLNLRH